MDEDNVKEEGGASGGAPQMDELTKTQAERDEYLKGWQRANADLANYRKDEAKRFDDFAKYKTDTILKECITILDSFDLAIASIEKQAGGGKNGIEKGIYLIRSQMENMLKNHGVTRMVLKAGDVLDPMKAEALMEESSETIQEGNITEEITPGYMLHDKVLRAAQVKISKGNAE
jgi:molecular chaperone GrpE